MGPPAIIPCMGCWPGTNGPAWLVMAKGGRGDIIPGPNDSAPEEGILLWGPYSEDSEMLCELRPSDPLGDMGGALTEGLEGGSMIPPAGRGMQERS